MRFWKIESSEREFISSFVNSVNLIQGKIFWTHMFVLSFQPQLFTLESSPSLEAFRSNICLFQS